MIKVGSDFSGIGAFDSALKSLNIPFANIYACDIDKFAKKSYLANHTADNFYHDVYDRPIPQDSLDIYMTSPPCQAFSTAGKMQGEQDKRGILFYNSLEFIKTNKPKVFIIENVKGLISTDGGAIFTKWIDSLCGGYVNGVDNSLVGDKDAPPYNLHYKVLNSKDYGVAQSRERIFIVGIRTDIDFDYEFPAPTDNSKRLKDFLQDEVAEKYYLCGARLKVIADWEVEHKAKGNTGLKFGLKHPDEVGGAITTRCGGRNTDTFILENPPKLMQAGVLDGEKYEKRYISTRRVYCENGLAPTILTAIGGGLEPKVYQAGTIRKLTPLECWRLQGFSDEQFFNAKNNADMSDSQLYKQAGNSITVNVLAELIKNLLPVFERK